MRTLVAKHLVFTCPGYRAESLDVTGESEVEVTWTDSPEPPFGRVATLRRGRLGGLAA